MARVWRLAPALLLITLTAIGQVTPSVLVMMSKSLLFMLGGSMPAEACLMPKPLT
jgi:hypothetical protein